MWAVYSAIVSTKLLKPKVSAMNVPARARQIETSSVRPSVCDWLIFSGRVVS